MMRFELVQHVHAPIEAIEEALVDPRFLDALAGLPKLGRPKLLDQRQTGDRIFQRVRYDFEGDLNATVRAFIDPSKLSWVEESTQDRASHLTDIAIVPDNYTSIFAFSGQTRLEPGSAPGTTVRTTTGEVTVRVPLVGGKAEAAIISGLCEHSEREEAVLNDWLSHEDHRRSAG
jgi:hypothetical protein